MRHSARYFFLLFVPVVVVSGIILADPVEVSAQTISYVALPDEIGSGLQSLELRARLSDSQHGGTTVRVQSADTMLAFVSDGEQTPGTEFVDIFVPNGSIDAFFFIQTVEDTTGNVSITASATGFASEIDSVDIVQPAIQLSGLSGSVDVYAADDDFRVQIGIPNDLGTYVTQLQAARAGGPGFTATVRNSNAAAAQLVTTALTDQVVAVVILPGQNASGPNVALGGVAFDGTAPGMTEVTASIPGFFATSADTQQVSVLASTISFAGLPFEVGAGLGTGQKRVTLSGTQHGGVYVHIESSDSAIALVSTSPSVPGSLSVDVFIPNGVNQGNFYIYGVEDTTGAPTVTASAPGFVPANATVDVMTPALRIVGLATLIDTFDPLDPIIAQIGTPKADLSNLQELQYVRPGGSGLTVTMESSDAGVGLLLTLADTSAIATTTIAAGEYQSPYGIALGGVAFDGISIGSTDVTASIPGFVATAAGSVTVNVTQPGIAMQNFPLYGLGSGLQSDGVRARLGASVHGGVTVRIFSGDPQILLLSTHADSAGTDTVDVFVPDNQTDATFYLHAREDTTGAVTITASAPGFSDGGADVDVVAPGLKIFTGDLAGTLDTIDPPDAFRAQVGAPYNSNTTVIPQPVRVGSPGVVITATVDDSLRAVLQTLADTSGVATVMIPAGSSSSPLSVATGGMALDGIAPGDVTVALSSPGFVPVTTAQQVVTITAPTITITGLYSDIGAGLQSGVVTAQLSASGHGGTTLFVETDDSLTALVSDGETAAGSSLIVIPVPDGVTNPQFYVQGVDGATGTATITASAEQFVGDDALATVVQPAVDIVQLGSLLDVGDLPDPFQVRVGVPSSGNSYVQFPQKRRGGVAPLVAAVTTTDTTAARLATMSMSGDSVTVEVAAGESLSPPDLPAGGVELQPVAEGQTIVFASIPGFIQTGAAQKTVVVTNTSIIYLGLPTALGAGLETDVVTAQLGSSNHGGVTVHVEVDDTTKALVSSNALVVGGESVDIVVPNGQTDAAFYVQAFEDSLGTVLITTSAPGFTTIAQNVDIVPPAVQIVFLPDSMSVGDPDAEFVVQIGATRADSSEIVEMQLVRAGGTPAVVTVTSSDVGVGTIETSSTSGDTAVVTIGIAEGQTAETVLLGGLAFRAVGTGAALVETSVPGFLTTAAGSPTVYVVGGPSSIQRDPPLPQFVLDQNIPNPFNPATAISFSIPRRMEVDLTVFDVSGRKVVTLLHGTIPAGRSSVEWSGRDANGRAVSSGVYFYRLRSGSRVQTKKMVLLK
jgi:hypothetical protein